MGTTAIGLVCGAVAIVILIGLHCTYCKKRDQVFPIEELDKFNQPTE